MKEINKFIKKRSHLIWYTKNYENLSEEAIVEAVLNYGNWNDVQKMISILGIQRIADIFKKGTKLGKMKRTNYDKKIKNYFQLYFDRYA